jgi:hypothetical protein
LNKNIFNNKRTFGYIPDNVNKKNKYSFNNKIKNNKTFEEQIILNDEMNDDNSDTQKMKKKFFHE